MTSQEIIKYIQKNKLQEYLFEEVNNSGETISKHSILGIVEQKTWVANTDEMNTVIHFKDHNVYIKLEGWYDSYGQGEHQYTDAIYEVFPKTIETIIYQNK